MITWPGERAPAPPRLAYQLSLQQSQQNNIASTSQMPLSVHILSLEGQRVLLAGLWVLCGEDFLVCSLRAGLAGVSLGAREAARPDPDRGYGRRGTPGGVQPGLGLGAAVYGPKVRRGSPRPREAVPPDLLPGRLEAEGKGWSGAGGRGENLRVWEPGGREAQPAQLGLDQRRSCC